MGHGVMQESFRLWERWTSGSNLSLIDKLVFFLELAATALLLKNKQKPQNKKQQQQKPPRNQHKEVVGLQRVFLIFSLRKQLEFGGREDIHVATLDPGQ